MFQEDFNGCKSIHPSHLKNRVSLIANIDFNFMVPTMQVNVREPSGFCYQIEYVFKFRCERSKLNNNFVDDTTNNARSQIIFLFVTK